jgi:phosphatidylinositol alpha-mannosyltransferase
VDIVGRPIGIPFNGSVAPVCFSGRSARRIRTVLRDWRPDIVHVHEPFAPSTSLLTTLMTSQPVVATFHAHVERAFLHRALAPVARRIWARTDQQLAVSETCAAFLESALGVRLDVVPNGIDVPAGSPRPRRAARGGPVLLFVGRLEPRKGLAVLLRAFALLLPRFPDLSLVVVGDGPDRRAVQSLPASVRARVVMHGLASDRVVFESLRGAHAFVAPATGQESFGIVLLEAMAAGLPLIASNIAGYRSVVRDDVEAVLVTPGDGAALAAGIARVLSDNSLAARLVANGTRRVADFSWTGIAEQIDSHYERALAARMPQRSRPVAVRRPRTAFDAD